MTNAATTIQNDELVVPMYSWWQVLLMSLFDINFSEEKFVPSSDPEVRSMSIYVPKYSWRQVIKMTFCLTDE